MDVGIPGKPRFSPDHCNDDAAAAAGTTITDICALGGDNSAMTRIASGAVALTRHPYAGGNVRA